MDPVRGPLVVLAVALLCIGLVIAFLVYLLWEE
jgi:hypothetical protein